MLGLVAEQPDGIQSTFFKLSLLHPVDTVGKRSDASTLRIGSEITDNSVDCAVADHINKP